MARGRLRLILPEAYAAAPGGVTEEGWLMAAVLSCGSGSALSHWSAAFSWGLARELLRPIDVTLPAGRQLERPALRVHRSRRTVERDFGVRNGIPVTSPARTLLDLAVSVQKQRLERLVNEADKRGLIAADELRESLEGRRGEPGVRALRSLLDRDTFRLTDSELERRFLALVRDAGLPMPVTRQLVNGFLVDFFWPEHGVVVETDGLRYHRTPASQARDLERDRAHLLAGLIPLRFTHAQVAGDPESVIAALAAALERGYSSNTSSA